MRDRGIRWIPMFGRQAYKVGGKFRFWGGLVLEAVGGGPGLIDMEYESAAKAGDRRALRGEGHAPGHRRRGAASPASVVRTAAGTETIAARAVVLASGGFEANPEMRTRYLGPNWELARVRGTPYNTGDGIRMALDIGALPVGPLERLPLRAVGPQRALARRPQGRRQLPEALVPARASSSTSRAERFVDEGADFRNYTYVKYGRAVIEQPRRTAFQIFDQKVVDILREEYRIREVTKAEANTFEELARKLEIDVEGFVRTMTEFNAAVQTGTCLQSGRQGRQGHARHHAAEVELGAAARLAALRRLRGDDGHHVHVRRTADHDAEGASSTASSGRSRGSTPPASWWAGSSTTTTRAAPDSWPARSSGASRAARRPGPPPREAR